MTIEKAWVQAVLLPTAATILLNPLTGVGAAAGTNTKEPLPFRPCTAFQPPALPNAHSHNDYENLQPLCDALRNGHTSVEADIWYVRNTAGEESLRLGHTSPSVGTLDELYLNKLHGVIKHNRAKYGRATVLPRYPGRFQLLIDVKSTGQEAERAFQLLHHKLRGKYRAMITHWHNGRKIPRQVDVVVTGTRPRNPVIDGWRFIGLDGEAAELSSRHQPGRCKRVPLVSTAWNDAYNNPGVLRGLVQRANVRGQYFRVYHTDGGNWQKLYDAGVHYIDSARHPSALRSFLKDRRPVPAPKPCIA